MTLQQASQVLDISKKRLWRAVKAGQLEAARVQRGGRWEYRVTREQLDCYRRKYLDSLEMKAVGWSATERSQPAPVSQGLESQLKAAHQRIAELEEQLRDKDFTELKLSHALAIIKEATVRERRLAEAARRLKEARLELVDLL